MAGLGGHPCPCCLVVPVGSHTAGLLQVRRFSIPRRIPCEAGQGCVSSWGGGASEERPSSDTRRPPHSSGITTKQLAVSRGRSQDRSEAGSEEFLEGRPFLERTSHAPVWGFIFCI